MRNKRAFRLPPPQRRFDWNTGLEEEIRRTLGFLAVPIFWLTAGRKNIDGLSANPLDQASEEVGGRRPLLMAPSA